MQRKALPSHPVFSPAFVLSVAVFCACLPRALAQQPLIYNRATFNSASFMPAGLPAGAIAQGSIFTVFGNYMGPTTGVSATSLPLSNALSGVSLTVTQGATTVNALPVYVSASQINAIMPSNAPIGTVSLQVLYNNARSNFTPVRIANTAFGIYTALGTGLGPGALENFVSQTNQPVNGPNVPAQPGQTITLYGTGLGPITGADNTTPSVGNLPVQVQVFVGGIAAAVQYSGRTPLYPGEDQIDFQVPSNAPLGCWVPVYVKTAGSVVSNFVSMAIQTAGGACTNATSPSISNIFLNGGNLGRAIVGRVNTVEDVGVTAPVTVTADYHLSFAFAIPTSAFPFNPAMTLPPPGGCTDYTESGDVTNANPLPGSLPPSAPLGLGAPLLLTGPNGMKTLTADFNAPFSVRSGQLGGFITNNILPNSLYLNPGAYSISGMGGTGVGPFSVNFTIPQPLNWTNQSSIGTVVRSQPLTLNWTGGETGDLDFVIGLGVDLPTNSSSIFVCSVPSGANTFAVPPDILANLPATRPNPLQSKDVIYLLSVQGPSIVNLNATGLTSGATSAYLINGKTVLFQ
jgi:uncharacterized protein (TIGR03437 family)